jgi:Fimbrial assembly protein (PilN)
MILINLLNSKVRSQINPQLTAIAISPDLVLTRDEIQKQAMLRLIIVIFFPLSLYSFDKFYYQGEMASQMPPLQKKISELTAFNTSKEKFVKDIEQFENEGKAIQGKIDKIKFLNSLRGHEIEVHKFFQKSLPEKLWFEELEYSFDPSKKEDSNTIKVKGYSFNPSDVQNLRQEIKKHILFSQCEVKSQSQAKFEGRDVESFEMIITMGNAK